MAISVCGFPCWAQPASDSQGFVFQVANGEPPATLSVEPFDSLGNRRSLTGVQFDYQGELSMAIEVQNHDPQPYANGSWAVDAYLNTLLSFRERPGFADGGPFFGLGNIAMEGVTGDLSAGEGGGPFGEGSPGDVRVSASTSDTVTSTVTFENDVDYFLHDETLEAVIGPLFDIVLTPPPGSFFINTVVTDVSLDGVLELTYLFDLVGDTNDDGQLDGVDIDNTYRGIAEGNLRYDLDQNGVADDSDVSYLVEDLMGTVFGDSNLDGRFDSSDLVHVFAIGEYEDAIANNSTWNDGDWDGDRDFTTSDLVSAFGKGAYSVSAQAVPEPGTGVGIYLLVLLLGWSRRRR